MINLLTKENITFILAVIGSLGTTIGGIYQLYTRRIAIDILPEGYNLTDKSVLFYISFINKSHIPISITDIRLTINDKRYTCRKTPIRVFYETHKQGGRIISHYDYNNLTMPITLSNLAGNSGYILFEFPLKDFPQQTTDVIFEVSTNRHKIIRKKLSLEQVPHLRNN